MKKILLIDMDGVLAENKSEDFEITKRQPQFFIKKKPIKGAVEAFKFLSKIYDCHIVSTPVWSNPLCWKEKREWVDQHLGSEATKRLTLTHNKQLVMGDYLIDDSLKHGVMESKSEHIHFGSEQFPNWESVINYLTK
jgi:5'-nucleotidase